MRKTYSEEFKESVIEKMMPPNPVPVLQICRETGVSDVTLYKWRKDYRNRGIAVPSDQNNSNNWTAEDKLAAIIETASFNEIELSEYCRTKGLYVEDIQQWKISAISGCQQDKQLKKGKQASLQTDKKEIKRLKSELRRKEKALAETAALLVLSKKCEAIWGGDEED